MPKVCVQDQTCDLARRKAPVYDSAIVFCPDCGNRLQVLAGGPIEHSYTGLETASTGLQAASRGARAGAFLVDILVSILLGLVAIVPVIGQLIAGLLLSFFWLFRDVNGGSPGKSVLGLSVVARGGGPASSMQRIMRNLTLSLPLLTLIIPFIGYGAAPLLDVIATLVEAAMLLFTGQRLGDRMADTMVVKRASASSASVAI